MGNTEIGNKILVLRSFGNNFKNRDFYMFAVPVITLLIGYSVQNFLKKS
jgi:hypothetical protein